MVFDLTRAYCKTINVYDC